MKAFNKFLENVVFADKLKFGVREYELKFKVVDWKQSTIYHKIAMGLSLESSDDLVTEEELESLVKNLKENPKFLKDCAKNHL